MAKKTKRSVSRRQMPGVSVSRNTATEFNPDYSAVKSDLKRIGILAGSFFVILIVLSFFLR